MLEIVINNNDFLEVENEPIKYTKQANDIAELSSRQTNFTNSFSIKRTFKNTHIFQNLGIVGDISQVPYQKINASLLENGYHLIRNSWLEVKETTKNEYKLNIRDGIIDLFKAIENKTFGDDVDLSEINHDKNLNNIIASFTNENYRYIINDYGGKTHTNNETKINIDYLIPSVRVKYLWDKIFSTFGFNYIGTVFDTSDFEGLWLTYPKGVPLETTNNTILYASFLGYNSMNVEGEVYPNITINTGNQINGNKYVFVQSGTYKIKFDGIFNYDYEDPYGNVVPNNTLFMTLFLNGNAIAYNDSSSEIEFNYQFNVGDILFVGVPQYIFENPSNPLLFFTEAKNFKVEKYDTLISFSEELKQLSITDFFKEILWRFNLTIFQDIDDNYIFKTFDQRLKSGIVDWSEKYVERTNEYYNIGGYGQANIFLENYNDKDDYYNDGSFLINNKNLKEKVNIINSKFYSHEKKQELFVINSNENEILNETRLFEKKISENTDIQEVKYKELSNRFHLIRLENIDKQAVLKSENLTVEQSVESLPVARFYMTVFKDFVPKYYNNIQILLNDFRLHKMKLKLNCIDFINLDLDKIYYFEQEQNFYIINKITYENGKLCDVEMYRIKYSEQQNIIP